MQPDHLVCHITFLSTLTVITLTYIGALYRGMCDTNFLSCKQQRCVSFCAVSNASPCMATPLERSVSAPSTSNAGSVSESTFTGLGATSGTNPRSGTGTPGTSMPSMADFSPEMQEQMRKQMKDPVMKEVGAPLASCSSLAQFVNERERDR